MRPIIQFVPKRPANNYKIVDGKQYEYLVYTLLENTFGRGQF